MTEETKAGDDWDAPEAKTAETQAAPKRGRPSTAKPAAAPAKVAALPTGDDGLVAVRCIVDNEPWSSEGKMAKDDEHRVSPAAAKVMLDNGQVELA